MQKHSTPKTNRFTTGRLTTRRIATKRLTARRITTRTPATPTLSSRLEEMGGRESRTICDHGKRYDK